MDKLLKEIAKSVNKASGFNILLMKAYDAEIKRKRIISDLKFPSSNSEKLFLEEKRVEAAERIKDLTEEINSFWKGYKFNQLPY